MERKKTAPATMKIFSFVMRIAVAAGIVGYLVKKHGGNLSEGFGDIIWPYAVLAAVLYVFHMCVCAWRWHVLSRVLKIRLSRFEALSLTMQAYFFSLVIPGGSVGGDIAKVGVLASRSERGNRLEGAMTILMDRIVGMVALFGLTIISVLASLNLLMNVKTSGFELTAPLRILLISAVLGICFAGLGASVVFFFHRRLEKIPVLKRLFGWFDRVSKGRFERFTSAFDAYARSWKTILAMTLASVFLVHLMLVAVVVAIMAALGFSNFDLAVVIPAVLIGSIAGLIPISPSGVGLRDAAMCGILGAGGIADPLLIPLALSTLIVSFNLLSGLFFIFSPKKREPVSGGEA